MPERGRRCLKTSGPAPRHFAGKRYEQLDLRVRRFTVAGLAVPVMAIG